jgi:hypothetical protein
MRLNLQRVSENVARSPTEDLLDRITVYREGMEPEALELIEAELRHRGVPLAAIEVHEANRRRTMLTEPDGLPMKCARCWRPAVVEVREWYWLWKIVPIFPWRRSYCEEHRPAGIEQSIPLTPDPSPPKGRGESGPRTA